MPAIEEIISELTGTAQTVSQPGNFVLSKQLFTLITTLQMEGWETIWIKFSVEEY